MRTPPDTAPLRLTSLRGPFIPKTTPNPDFTSRRSNKPEYFDDELRYKLAKSIHLQDEGYIEVPEVQQHARSSGYSSTLASPFQESTPGTSPPSTVRSFLDLDDTPPSTPPLTKRFFDTLRGRTLSQSKAADQKSRTRSKSHGGDKAIGVQGILESFGSGMTSISRRGALRRSGDGSKGKDGERGPVPGFTAPHRERTRRSEGSQPIPPPVSQPSSPIRRGYEGYQNTSTLRATPSKSPRTQAALEYHAPSPPEATTTAPVEPPVRHAFADHTNVSSNPSFDSLKILASSPRSTISPRSRRARHSLQATRASPATRPPWASTPASPSLDHDIDPFYDDASFASSVLSGLSKRSAEFSELDRLFATLSSASTSASPNLSTIVNLSTDTDLSEDCNESVTSQLANYLADFEKETPYPSSSRETGKGKAPWDGNTHDAHQQQLNATSLLARRRRRERTIQPLRSRDEPLNDGGNLGFMVQGDADSPESAAANTTGDLSLWWKDGGSYYTGAGGVGEASDDANVFPPALEDESRKYSFALALEALHRREG